MKKEPLSSFKLSKEGKKKLKNRDYLKRQFARGKTGQQVLGFSDESIAEFYEAALVLLEKGRYETAANAFLFLITLNPYCYEYWLGAGVSAQESGHIEEAIDAYEMSTLYSGSNPVPYFYLAKCFIALKDRESALDALNLALEYSEDFEEFSELKEHVLEAKSMLTRKK